MTHLQHLEQENKELKEKKSYWCSRACALSKELTYYTSGQYDQERNAALLRALLPSHAVGQYIPGEQEIKNILNSVKI